MTKLFTMIMIIIVIFANVPIVTTEAVNVIIPTIIKPINITEEVVVNSVVDYTYLLSTDDVIYPPNSCELIAKNNQVNGSHIVYIAPYDTITGAWKTGEFVGHWINSVHINGTEIFIDHDMQKVFTNKDDTINYYNNDMKNKFENGNIEVKLYVYGEDTMPYPMTYHY